MKVLVACEYSGIVRDAFTMAGHEAWSLDILPTESPGKHWVGKVEDIDDYFPLDSWFWDLIIFHPPCTAMSLSGNGTYGANKAKHHERQSAIRWTTQQVKSLLGRCSKLCVENPTSVLFNALKEDMPDSGELQYIQPYQFGHPEQKKTGLMLYNLPELVETDNVHNHMMALPKKEREKTWYMSPSKDRGKQRSKFFTGIAEAMAQQWGQS